MALWWPHRGRAGAELLGYDEPGDKCRESKHASVRAPVPSHVRGASIGAYDTLYRGAQAASAKAVAPAAEHAARLPVAPQSPPVPGALCSARDPHESGHHATGTPEPDNRAVGPSESIERVSTARQRRSEDHP